MSHPLPDYERRKIAERRGPALDKILLDSVKKDIKGNIQMIEKLKAFEAIIVKPEDKEIISTQIKDAEKLGKALSQIEKNINEGEINFKSNKIMPNMSSYYVTLQQQFEKYDKLMQETGQPGCGIEIKEEDLENPLPIHPVQIGMSR